VINNLPAVKLITSDDGEVFGVWTSKHWKPMNDMIEQFRKIGMEEEATNLTSMLDANEPMGTTCAYLQLCVIKASHLCSDWLPTIDVETTSRVGVSMFSGKGWKVKGDQVIELDTDSTGHGHWVRATVRNGIMVKLKRFSNDDNVKEIVLEKRHDILPYLYQYDLKES
jgi:hypothetical protein